MKLIFWVAIGNLSAFLIGLFISGIIGVFVWFAIAMIINIWYIFTKHNKKEEANKE
jgi:hypothetical protein